MNKLNKTVRKSGISAFFSLFLLMLLLLFVYHIITVFGLSYFFTQNDISLGSIGEDNTYAKARFDTARMIKAGGENEDAIFAVLCPDGRSSFLLKTTEQKALKINKTLEKGKTVKLRGKAYITDEETHNKYLPFFVQYGYETNLIRNNYFVDMSFADFWKQHPIINSLTLILLLLIIFFMIRGLMYGSYGSMKKNARKFGYDIEDIAKDFETAEKYGSLNVGQKYFIITKNPISAVSGDDTVLAYIHHVVEKVSFNFIPFMKHNLYSLILVDKKGKEYEIRYPNEAKAAEALAAVSKFGHITTSTTDEFRNSARSSVKPFVQRAEDKKKEIAELTDKQD